MGRIFEMHVNYREEIREVRAGDIAAVVSLKSVSIRDTLCNKNLKIMITLEKMNCSEPLVFVAVEPITSADHEKMAISLSKLATEESLFQVRTDEESGQTIISGMSELHFMRLTLMRWLIKWQAIWLSKPGQKRPLPFYLSLLWQWK